jgi:hypothetical protein
MTEDGAVDRVPERLGPEVTPNRERGNRCPLLRRGPFAREVLALRRRSDAPLDPGDVNAVVVVGADDIRARAPQNEPDQHSRQKERQHTAPKRHGDRRDREDQRHQCAAGGRHDAQRDQEGYRTGLGEPCPPVFEACNQEHDRAQRRDMCGRDRIELVDRTEPAGLGRPCHERHEADQEKSQSERDPGTGEDPQLRLGEGERNQRAWQRRQHEQARRISRGDAR